MKTLALTCIPPLERFTGLVKANIIRYCIPDLVEVDVDRAALVEVSNGTIVIDSCESDCREINVDPLILSAIAATRDNSGFRSNVALETPSGRAATCRLSPHQRVSGIDTITCILYDDTKIDRDAERALDKNTEIVNAKAVQVVKLNVDGKRMTSVPVATIIISDVPGGLMAHGGRCGRLVVSRDVLLAISNSKVLVAVNTCNADQRDVEDTAFIIDYLSTSIQD